MPELRKDPIVDRWVIVAPERARRPIQLAAEPRLEPTGPCPFCEGNERETPHEILALRAESTCADQPGWRVRVVPNKFPALAMQTSAASGSGGQFDERRDGLGIHEVIVESPRHLRTLTELSALELRDVFWVYRQRLAALADDQRLAHAVIFKNMGAAAGATVEHVHSQLIATPLVPPAVAERLAGSQRFWRECGRCVFCQLIDEALSDRERLVVESPRFVAFCPFAARFPYETWLLPRQHAAHFHTLAEGDLAELASVARRVLCALEAVLPQPAYNYAIQSAPFDSSAPDHYHWHMEIIPRVTNVGGFEWASGLFINTVPAEEAAARLRAADAKGQAFPAG
jgi:UDPglucose--hexose-1-phosphate uridylyltransferase